MRKQAEHRIRGAASLARPGVTWVAAIVMNATWAAGAAVAGWIAWTAYEPALRMTAGILFGGVLLWTVLLTMESWRVLRRFARRARFTQTRPPISAPPPPTTPDPPSYPHC